jgi:hypothetical protein
MLRSRSGVGRGWLPSGQPPQIFFGFLIARGMPYCCEAGNYSRPTENRPRWIVESVDTMTLPESYNCCHRSAVCEGSANRSIQGEDEAPCRGKRSC